MKAIIYFSISILILTSCNESPQSFVSNSEKKAGNYKIYVVDDPALSGGITIWIYPNPVHQTVYFMYVIENEAALVTASLENIVGDEIQRIVHGYHKPGRFKVALDLPEKLKNGAYLIHVKTDYGAEGFAKFELLKLP